MSTMEEGSKRLTVGRRFSVDKVKEEVHENQEEQKESFKKLEEKHLQVASVSKALRVMPAANLNLRTLIWYSQ